MRLTTRLATMVSLAILISLNVGAVAHADGSSNPTPRSDVECGPQGCQIDVGTPGSPGGNPGGGNGGGGNGGGGPVNNCAYTPADVSAERAAELGHPLDGPGRWYWRTCLNPSTGEVDSFTEQVWLASPPPMISPAVLAQRARSTLRPPPVTVSINPHPTTLVRMPVWLAASSGWAQVSQTASVPGMAVTATATPIRTTWWMGGRGQHGHLHQPRHRVPARSAQPRHSVTDVRVHLPAANQRVCHGDGDGYLPGHLVRRRPVRNSR